MSFSLPLLGGLAAVLVLLVRPLFSPLRSVPGPFLARWTDAWYLYKVWRGDFEKTNRRLHEVYGPIVRYGPNRYSVSDATAIDIIYGHGSQFAKSSWYSAWAKPPPWTAREAGAGTLSLFNDQSISRHVHNRRQFQSTYSMTSLVSYEPYADECADIFAQRLEEFANAGTAVDLRYWFQCYAFDVIGMITYAKRFGFLDAGEDIGGVIRQIEDFFLYGALVGIYPSLHPLLYRLKNLMAGEKGYGRNYILKFALERLNDEQTQAKAQNSERESFLAKFMAKNAKDPETFTNEHTIAGCLSNVSAGSDTTAISLSAVFHFLLSNPDCLGKLQDEVDSLHAQGQLSRNPTFKETQQMPYLQAVMKEALRLHPIAGLPLERVVPEKGSTIGGVYFPPGTVVGLNIWVEHRNPAFFGDDADCFRPERWLTTDAEKLRVMNRHWVPFGIGSRTCIGRHISMLEMSKLIPRIIRDFDLHPSATSSGDTWPVLNTFIVRPTDFTVKFGLRDKSAQA